MPSEGVHLVTDASERADAIAVRRAVFVDEQGVPESVELDGNDDDATHFVAYDADGEPVGAARLRTIDDDTGKVERVAVLAEHRGEGWGRRLLTAVEATARYRGLADLVLHSQTHVEEFYRELGYETVGEEFEEAGIPHVEMRTRLA
ncbi:MAG: GNAT family N-acetyltransferase [Haloarculaceae archaeon]